MERGCDGVRLTSNFSARLHKADLYSAPRSIEPNRYTHQGNAVVAQPYQFAIFIRGPNFSTAGHLHGPFDEDRMRLAVIESAITSECHSLAVFLMLWLDGGEPHEDPATRTQHSRNGWMRLLIGKCDAHESILAP